jgi:hypothetical protein
LKPPEKDDPFRSLSPEELAKVEPLSIEVIEAALEEGRRARQAVIDSHVIPYIPSGLRFR